MNRLFFKTVRRNFSNQYHHDFDPGKIPSEAVLNKSLIGFEAVRVIFYVVITVKLLVKGPSFFAFRKTKFTNNPDYLLHNEVSVEKALAMHKQY